MKNILNKLDYKLRNYEDRLKLVNDILGYRDIFPNEEWMKVFEPTYNGNIETSNIKCHLNKDDALYSDSSMAKALEVIGTYLLNSYDIRENEKKNKIKIYHSKELFERALKEDMLRQKINPISEDELDINVFVKQKNYKKSKDIVIKDVDIGRNKVLNDYSILLDSLRSKYKCMSNKSNDDDLKKKKLIKKHIGLIKKDMLDTYNSYYKPIVFKNPLKDSGIPDWNYFDFLDKKQVKELIYIQKTDDINNDLNHLILDLDILISEINWTERQKVIINLVRSGYNNKSIAEKLNITSPTVSKLINTCVKKICEFAFEKYLDWYYLNICKGKYKQCSICKNNILIQFFIDDNKNICKKCRKLKINKKI